MILFYSFVTISLIFIAVLAARGRLPRLVCAICAGIALTWLGLLALSKLGGIHDDVILALLMGQSISGLFYLLRDKVPRSLRIFTLPFFLSLTAASYALIKTETVLLAFGLVAVVWVVAWAIFIYRNDPGKKPLVDNVMDCCGGEK
ncbi:hypothetical protein RAAC3_TM7C00001G0134 [Candidatus Saccharibacteria bacterium RAAC3_TM7_1]|nr:hypothetical protein RAAC3_TM7C00001G0134 [Candidatus Saccharibacteria bacterium RAAC3_TM7_1]HCZ28839.1 hypothetical protein [Candidatus Saccharibacteria bacterium]